MRYRIQIETMLDCVLVVVTEIRGEGEYISLTRKCYTMSAQEAHHGGLYGVLNWLTEQVAATQP
jgi:hypothetical protein